jgi:hypothetical protein
MTRVGICRLSTDGLTAVQRKYNEGRWANVAAFCQAQGISRSLYYDLVARRKWFEEATVQDKLAALGLDERNSRYYEFKDSDPNELHNLARPHSFVTEQAGQSLQQTPIERGAPALDNDEHLLAACAQLAAAFLRACSEMKGQIIDWGSLSSVGDLMYCVPGLTIPMGRDRESIRSFMKYQAVCLVLTADGPNHPAVLLVTADNERRATP